MLPRMPKPSVGTVYLLKRAELAVRSCIEVALAQFDLTPAQFLLMVRLRDRSKLSAAALARDIGVRPQSIIGLTGPLERHGLLEREPSVAHRRILHIRLTASGRKLLAEASAVAGQLEEEPLSGLSAAQLSQLQESLTLLRESAESHVLHPGCIRARAEEIMRAHLATGRRRGLRAAPRSLGRGVRSLRRGVSK